MKYTLKIQKKRFSKQQTDLSAKKNENKKTNIQNY